MCLIVFSYKAHPKYKLIVAANRDEFYNRPTRPAQFWTDEGQPQLLAGKDLKANGTWMGISKNGTWGALTNYRDLSNIIEDAPTRGMLVLDFLKSEESPNEYLKDLQGSAQNYNGFNLLIGDTDKIYHYSNESQIISEIDAGIHGVSNALLNTSWPKLDAAKKNLQGVLSNNMFEKKDLFQILKSEEKAPDNQLPSTGLSYELEKAISSVFIKTENYGTLCSTLLMVDYDGNAEFTERRYDSASSKIIEEKTFQLCF